MGQTDPVSFDKASADRIAAVVTGYEAGVLSHKPRTRHTRDTTRPPRRLGVWVIVREVEFDDVPWIWIERAKASEEYDTNGGLFVPFGPPEGGVEPIEGESPADLAKRQLGWQKMAVWPHAISQDYRPAVWSGPVVDREPDVFPAEKRGGNWHVGLTWRLMLKMLSQNLPMGSCQVVQ